MRVFCATGSAPPVVAAARLYSRRHAVEIEVEVCGRQCREGHDGAHSEPHGFTTEVLTGGYALAIAGSEADIDDLEMTTAVTPGSRRSLGLREAAILTPANGPGGIRSFDDLSRPGTRIAVSTIDCLRGVWEDVASRAGCVDPVRRNITHRVTGCMALIETLIQGRVDAAIGWSSFVHFHPDITSIPLPESYRIFRSTGAAVLEGAGDPALAGSFIDFLCSDEGRDVFSRHGWVYPAHESSGAGQEGR